MVALQTLAEAIDALGPEPDVYNPEKVVVNKEAFLKLLGIVKRAQDDSGVDRLTRDFQERNPDTKVLYAKVCEAMDGSTKAWMSVVQGGFGINPETGVFRFLRSDMTTLVFKVEGEPWGCMGASDAARVQKILSLYESNVDVRFVQGETLGEQSYIE